MLFLVNLSFSQFFLQEIAFHVILPITVSTLVPSEMQEVVVARQLVPHPRLRLNLYYIYNLFYINS